MNELINRVFKIWAYTVSHSFLILRSPLKYEDQEGYDERFDYNIDVEFSAVAYLDVPNILRGIVINQVEDNIPQKFQRYRIGLGYKVFEIISEGNRYYIVAGGYRVGKSKWISEDRVQNMDLEYDEVIALS